MTALNSYDIDHGFERHMSKLVRHTLCHRVSELSTVDALDMARDHTKLLTCYCLICGRRLPVNNFVWFDSGEPVGS
jgi:hypothetical protein